jgi:uncharacterized OB-fold protein
MDTYTKPIPVASVESAPYWNGLREHRLLMPRCDECKQFWFPPSLLCPHCGSDHNGWQEVSGSGRVFSYVVVHRVYHPGFAEDVPYVVAVIELDEGPRMISNVTGIAPDKVACDLRVRIVFEDIAGEMTLPKFAVVGGHAGRPAQSGDTR